MPKGSMWTLNVLAPGRRADEDAVDGVSGRRGCLRYLAAMNPVRKRTVRLVVALSAAVVLASALIYTSFSAASPALTPSQLVREGQAGRSYQLTGTVVAGSVRRDGGVLDFKVEDRAGGTAVPLAYTGTVPDPFREGREVIVTVQKQGGRYIGERNSLITKCPSKYKTAPVGERQNY
jgi:cytochrome c-type biogenesis protein CcmE